MITSMLNGLAPRAMMAAATLLVACGGSSGGSVPPSSGPGSGASPEATTPPGPPGNVAAPDAIYGDWHEDHNASTEDRAVFVPRSVDLGPSHYRRTLSFGKDGSFSTLRLDPADAHYECKGTFTFLPPNKLAAQCLDPKTRKEIPVSIQIL